MPKGKQRQTNTATAVTEEMLVLAERQIKTAHTIRFVRTKHVLPRLGERPIEQVTLLEINRLLDSLVAQERVGTPEPTLVSLGEITDPEERLRYRQQDNAKAIRKRHRAAFRRCSPVQTASRPTEFLLYLVML